MSGNKGAVGIRLDYHDTSFCFVTAHLAAGHLDVEERNNDYWTVVNGLHFLKGKTIGSHEYVMSKYYQTNNTNPTFLFLLVETLSG